jgi:hypothetical protein
MIRRLVVAVGVGAAAVGLAITLGPLGRPFDVNDAFVLVVGVLALVQGLRYLLERRGAEYAATEFGDPERRYRVPVPGDDADDSIAFASGLSYAARKRRRDVREHLRDVATETLELRENCSPSEATDRLDDGDWTDDPFAAHFLSRGAVSLPLALRLRATLSRRSRFAFYAAHTVAAIDEAGEVAA